MRRVPVAILLLLWMGVATNQAAGDVLWLAEVAGGGNEVKVDTKLREFAFKAEKAWGLSGLRLIEAKKRDISIGESGSGKFKSGYQLAFKCLGRDATRYHLEISLSDREGGLLTTEVRLARGAPLLLKGPLQQETGETMLFLVEVR